ncbi:MAG: hypothetical protein M3R04_00035 [bacterium]|nr:hypothetical protein [bacterium]
MASTIITRLKKTGQQVQVKDSSGAVTSGVISWWDDDLFAVRTAEGDEVAFAIAAFASLTIPGGVDHHSIASRSDTPE